MKKAEPKEIRTPVSEKESTISPACGDWFEQVFKNHTMVALLLDPSDGAILHANIAASKFYGYPIETLCGMTIFQINHMDKGMLEAEIMRAQSEEKNTFIFTHHLANGETRRVEIHSSPVMHMGNNMLLSLIHDVTSRVGVEETLVRTKTLLEAEIEVSTKKLRAGQERLQSILQYLDVIVFSIPTDTNEAPYVSQVASKIFGRTLDEILERGLFCPEFACQDDREKLERFRKEVFSHGSGILNFRVLRPDGQVIWVQERAHIVRDEAGNIMRLDGSIMDVTLAKRAENELIKAREQADSASRAKSEFIAIMSHEIRTPIQCIFGYTELLQNTGLDEEQSKFARVICSQIDTLLNLINSILDFSKIESGKVELELVPIKLSEWLFEICQVMKPAADRKGLAMNVKMKDGCPAVIIGDSGRIGQVLLNLIGNAIKFTEAGRVDISLEAEKIEAGRAMLHFKVLDTGIGIPLEKMKQLFDSFTQGDSSMARKYGGAGLGLAICRGLCELMGGEISVERNPEGGSCFHFTAWFDVFDGAAHGSAGHDGTAEKHAGFKEIDFDFAHKHPLEILIVEDNEVALEMATELLKCMGYSPDGAGSGIEALKCIEGKKYDTVLMDVQMPGLDGCETAQILCGKYSPEQRPRIIAMTANVMDEDRRRCFDSGMDDFLSKPVRIELLQNALLGVVAKSSDVCGLDAESSCEPSDDTDVASMPTLDPAVLGELKKIQNKSSSSLLRRIQELMQNETPNLMGEILSAIEHRDHGMLERAAHSIKGSSQMIGARKMAYFSSRMVELARSGTTEGAFCWFNELKIEFKNVCEAWKNQIAQDGK